VKIPKSTREQAAMICAIAASTPDLSEAYGAVCERLGIRTGADRAFRFVPVSYRLAMAAWRTSSRNRSGAEADAEAEALLRCGWSPGEEA
jgi:hypothetical protein